MMDFFIGFFFSRNSALTSTVGYHSGIEQSISYGFLVDKIPKKNKSNKVKFYFRKNGTIKSINDDSKGNEHSRLWSQGITQIYKRELNLFTAFSYHTISRFSTYKYIYTYKVYCCTKFRYSLNMNDFLPLQFQVSAVAEVGVPSAAVAAVAVATQTKIIQFKNVNIQEGILMNPMA